MLILLFKGYKQASNIFHNFYANSAIMEEELSSAKMQAAVGSNYGKLWKATIHF